MIWKCNSQRRISMTAKKVTQTTKKAENVKINAPAKTVETAKAETAVKAETEVKEAPKAEKESEDDDFEVFDLDDEL